MYIYFVIICQYVIVLYIINCHTHTYIYLDQPKSQGSGTIFWELRLVFATLWTGFRQVQVRRTSRTSRTAGGLWKKVGFWCCWMLV